MICDKCGGLPLSIDRHVCPPVWRVEDYEGYIDGKFYGADAEEAAEKASSESFWEEPSNENMPSGQLLKVTPIGEPEDRETAWVSVTGEATVDFITTPADRPTS